MNLSAEEVRFLTALLREQAQSGARGPAHQLLKENIYPNLPSSGLGSLAFTYDPNPLTTLLLDRMKLEEIDDFIRAEQVADVAWPWTSPQEYLNRLEEARREWALRRAAAPCSAPPHQVVQSI
jgi:hypothetical protein